MLSDDTRRIAIANITVDRADRQREKLLDIDELAASIAKNGLIHPIIIDRSYRLITGERRLCAISSLGHLDVLCRFVDNLSEVEKQILELEENIKRSDLGWKDLVKSMARIHTLYLQLDTDWTMTQTAEECNVAISLVSMYLRIHSHFSDERIAQASTVNEAYNIIKRRDNRAAGDALMELIELPSPSPSLQVQTQQLASELPPPSPGEHRPPPPPAIITIPPPEETILEADFLEWAPRYSGKKFNFLHCDFPYGIELFSGPQGRGSEPTPGYKDSFTLYTALVECLCKNLDRIMSISAHMIFWYSDRHRDVTRHMFSKLAPSLELHPYPLIWMKTNNDGIASDPRRGPRHIYETALFITRGKRQIVKIVADAYGSHTDHSLHPSTKPEPMLRHFFSMLVDEATTMFDPSCGSGASIRAAESLNAKATLGLEIDPAYLGPARSALKMSRLKQQASARVA